MINGFTFMGCGVRIKYVFVKVYAVGGYFRPEDFIGLKDDAAIEKALLDPNNHRTIRIVMNRSMTMDKYNDAIVEALTPRMNGQDLDK
jgi:DNA-binding transcriptional ArsR family regulator